MQDFELWYQLVTSSNGAARYLWEETYEQCKVKNISFCGNLLLIYINHITYRHEGEEWYANGQYHLEMRYVNHQASSLKHVMYYVEEEIHVFESE